MWRSTLPDAAELQPAAAASAPAAAAGLPPEPGLVAGEAPAGVAAPAGLGAAAWCLALAFGGFALFAVGTLALLPTLLAQAAGLSSTAAGQWTALAAVSAVLGSATAALLLLRQGVGLRGPVVLALGLPALLLFGVFQPAPSAGWAMVLMVSINILGGLFASLAFALMPLVAGNSGRMVRVNGLLAQCGAAGSLLGPPLMAACVQAGGWRAAALLGLGVTAAALPLAWRAVAAVSAAERAHRQAGHPLG